VPLDKVDKLADSKWSCATCSRKRGGQRVAAVQRYKQRRCVRGWAVSRGTCTWLALHRVQWADVLGLDHGFARSLLLCWCPAVPVPCCALLCQPCCALLCPAVPCWPDPSLRPAVPCRAFRGVLAPLRFVEGVAEGEEAPVLPGLVLLPGIPHPEGEC
jgi:hypothetical protein